MTIVMHILLWEKYNNCWVDDDDKARNKKIIFKNNVLFRSCISKINNTFIDNAEDIDIVMLMNNILGYSDICSMTSETLRKFYRDEINDDYN